MVFVDTGALFACIVPSDPDHNTATLWRKKNREPLITTDYVVDELLTLLLRRGEAKRAQAIGDELIAGEIAYIEWVQPADVQSAWSQFRDYTDKQWSFTDTVSKVIIDRLELKYAFAFDDHFRQFGNVAVVPS